MCLHFSEVCGWLPRPAVRGDSASWQRGAAQRGGVLVCLQGGAGLRRPGDFGFWDEGNSSGELQVTRTVFAAAGGVEHIKYLIIY